MALLQNEEYVCLLYVFRTEWKSQSFIESYHFRRRSYEDETMFGRLPILTVEQLSDLATPNIIFDP